MKKLILKAGRDRPIRQRQPWIFSGAIEKFGREEAGSTVRVESSEGELLGHAFLSLPNKSLAARMVSFGTQDPDEAIVESIKRALVLRKSLNLDSDALRLINGEGDYLPGLIVDSYAGHLVLQISNAGWEKRREWLKDLLISECQPLSIYEKSVGPSRKEERLEDREGQIYGETPEVVTVNEGDVKLYVPIHKGQKTGLFIDQREMRGFLRNLSSGKKVLNLFSYTGGFSLAALKGGANFAVSVDRSELALSLIEPQLEENGFDQKRHQSIQADVFSYVREQKKLDFDLIIVDPPALAKHAKDRVAAARAYKDLNREVMRRITKETMILTCSCSAAVDDKLFSQVISQAALEANVMAKVVGRHQMAPDHPVSLFHPQGSYLKSLLLISFDLAGKMD